MKLTDKQLEELLIKTFEILDKTKETCKVTISQCMFLNDLNQTNSLIRSCMETMDTCDLCKFFIINKSPNMKNCVNFTIKVLKTQQEECLKLSNDKRCKNMVEFCEKVVKESLNSLKKLESQI